MDIEKLGGMVMAVKLLEENGMDTDAIKESIYEEIDGIVGVEVTKHFTFAFDGQSVEVDADDNNSPEGNVEVPSGMLEDDNMADSIEEFLADYMGEHYNG